MPPVAVAESRWPARFVRLLVWVLSFRVIVELGVPAFFIAVWWGFLEWNHPAPSVMEQFAWPMLLFGFRGAVKRGLLPAAALLMAMDIGSLWIWRRLFVLWDKYRGHVGGGLSGVFH